MSRLYFQTGSGNRIVSVSPGASTTHCLAPVKHFKTFQDILKSDAWLLIAEEQTFPIEPLTWLFKMLEPRD